MPPRLLVVGIVLFWLATTSWLCYREVWPRIRAGDAPPFSIDLTDEVGANVIAWKVLQKNHDIGGGISWVKRLPDRTFKLHSEFKFHGLDILFLKVKKIEWSYQVTADGNLVGVAGKFRVRPKGNDDPHLFPDEEFGLSAKVNDDGQLEPTLTWNERTVFQAHPIPLSRRASVLNPTGMVNKIDGLRSGQAWAVPLFESLLFDSMPVGLPGKELLLPEVYAVVSDAILHWPKEDDLVACYRIDYSKPGDELVASTWVRRRDNMVLKQEARLHGSELTLVREHR